MRHNFIYSIEVCKPNGEWERAMYDVPYDYKSLVTIQKYFTNRGYQPKEIRLIKESI